MPYLNGARYLNEQGSASSSLPNNVFQNEFQLDGNGQYIVTGLTGGDTGWVTLTAITIPDDGSLFVFARTSTTVTVRSTAGSQHANVWFQFKLENFS